MSCSRAEMKQRLGLNCIIILQPRQQIAELNIKVQILKFKRKKKPSIIHQYSFCRVWCRGAQSIIRSVFTMQGLVAQAFLEGWEGQEGRFQVEGQFGLQNCTAWATERDPNSNRRDRCNSVCFISALQTAHLAQSPETFINSYFRDGFFVFESFTILLFSGGKVSDVRHTVYFQKGQHLFLSL